MITEARFLPASGTVGLLTNETKPAAQQAAERLAGELRARGLRVLARATVADQMQTPICAPAEDPDIAQADFVVVFGGDGTLLAASRLVAPYGTPLLGVHLGHFGFISEVAPQDLLRAVDEVLAGKALLEERVMLQGTIYSEGCEERTLLAVNDIVLASGAVRMIHVRTSIGGEELATYAADGVIVATPTGSTGYSLSAGGPLVHPSVPVLILTPICPHTLNARTMIVPASETIELRIESPTRDSGVVSVDGQIEIPLQPGEVVRVSSAPYCVRLLTTSGPNFYQKIRSRWHYGERETA